jgi:hypothetical protein
MQAVVNFAVLRDKKRYADYFSEPFTDEEKIDMPSAIPNSANAILSFWRKFIRFFWLLVPA